MYARNGIVPSKATGRQPMPSCEKCNLGKTCFEILPTLPDAKDFSAAENASRWREPEWIEYHGVSTDRPVFKFGDEETHSSGGTPSKGYFCFTTTAFYERTEVKRTV